jgi:phosphohistidine phosphatase
MRIFIMRHGQAEYQASSDQARQLTSKGKHEALMMGQILKNNEIDFDALFVSTYIRAQQTMNIVTTEVNNHVSHEVLDFITPSGSAQFVHDYIDGVIVPKKLNTILIVSHMPLVSYLVETLTGGQSSPIFPTAGIAEIDYDVEQMRGVLVKLTSPAELI